VTVTRLRGILLATFAAVLVGALVATAVVGYRWTNPSGKPYSEQASLVYAAVGDLLEVVGPDAVPVVERDHQWYCELTPVRRGSDLTDVGPTRITSASAARRAGCSPSTANPEGPDAYRWTVPCPGGGTLVTEESTQEPPVPHTSALRPRAAADTEVVVDTPKVYAYRRADVSYVVTFEDGYTHVDVTRNTCQVPVQ
jgi:hypothetical protein